MDKKEVTRRRALEFFGLAGTAGLTGCLSGGSPESTGSQPDPTGSDESSLERVQRYEDIWPGDHPERNVDEKLPIILGRVREDGSEYISGVGIKDIYSEPKGLDDSQVMDVWLVNELPEDPRDIPQELIEVRRSAGETPSDHEPGYHVVAELKVAEHADFPEGEYLIKARNSNITEFEFSGLSTVFQDYEYDGELDKESMRYFE